jgi:hypothetical protein
MDKNGKHTLISAYVFGVPGLLSFLLQLGLGLWLASLVLVGLACLAVGFVAGHRVGATVRRKQLKRGRERISWRARSVDAGGDPSELPNHPRKAHPVPALATQDPLRHQ